MRAGGWGEGWGLGLGLGLGVSCHYSRRGLGETLLVALGRVEVCMRLVHLARLV